ncbi:TIGR03936 family radical SAM-associated protein [uncultured Fusobacterium sp.]|uniref:TIGR03936 family radical SAM-associated protein n=1 Tax=uncultured Fusobacterium sp. TaxID=159267 RepID=UPI0015A68E42|nr:TIGR03936 family radical SAM-associated protein [uncultured Fusobacterium sp.]
MKKRLFFNKYDDMKYISHLDLLRVMDRLLRRSGVPIKYSQGFHPRPKISLGNPISLGTEAFNEPMDIELREDMTNDELMKRLNSKSVLGFEFTKVIDIDGKTSIADEYKEMRYEITGDPSSLEKLYNLLSQDEILLIKEKKGKVETKNLKPRIKFFERKGDMINLIIENMSPNSLLNICEVAIKDVAIKRFCVEK